MSDKKTILITGGAGFIGSHLCHKFIDEGHKVICVDSFFSGKKENISSLLANSRFCLIKHNIIKPLRLKAEKLDEIYHLACPASPMQYQFDPILTTKTSVVGTINVLNLARRFGARMLFTSTSEVYGDPLEHPQTEKYFGNVDPLGKRSCYDEGKRAAESLSKDYHQQYGVDVRIARLFNVYGPRMMVNDGRVMSNFIIQSLLGEDITIHGNGRQSRSFMYIDDLLDAFDKIMALPNQDNMPWLFNIGNPDERSMKSLAEDIKKSTGSNSRIVYLDYGKVPERLGDPQQRRPDISKAKERLGWEPRIGFREGLNKTIEDFKERLSSKTKVLIFSPAYFPFRGPAEEATGKICERMIAYDFDMISARMKKDLPKKEQIGRVMVYRVGLGTKWDKYLLPMLGPIKAWQLHKKNNYALAWSIMASYGALAAIIFSIITRRAYLVSLFEDKPDKKSKMRRRMVRPLSKMIFLRAHRLQFIAGLTQPELAGLEDERDISSVDMARGWGYISKKTREDFQQLEILSSRL